MEIFSNRVVEDDCAATAAIKILHLIIDDKFFNFISRAFQAVEDIENKYVAIVDENIADLKHLDGVPLWRTVGNEYANTPAAMEDMKWCDVLIVHWLHSAAGEVIEKAPASVLVVWSGWGGDYYDLLPGGETSLYGDRTKELLQQMRLQQMRLQQTHGTLKKTISNGLRRMKAVLKNVFGISKSRAMVDKNILIKRFDYFSAPIPEDYELLKAALGHQFRAEYVQLNYGSVEETFMLGECGLFGRDILLGNSATEANNHLEILDILSSINIRDRKVVVPLSYGSQEYGDEIEKCGRRLLGNNFVPIRHFMPLDEYNLLIASCSVAIMNHRRQQALGNIGTMLYHGAKLFLDEKNVVYTFFKKKGAYVFPVREIVERGEEAFIPLCKSEKERNIEVIEEVWGHDTVINNVRTFVDRMRQNLDRHA